MLNVEKYKNEIAKIGLENLAVVGDKPKACGDIAYKNCDFHCPNEEIRVDWLCPEYKEPEIDWDNDIDWRRVPVDTEVFVSNGEEDEQWNKRRFGIYMPHKCFPYGIFIDEKGRESAIDLMFYCKCKLENPEDIEKYRKR